AALLVAASVFSASSSFAQSGDAKGATPPPADAAKEAQRRTDEFAEASKLVNGPAGNPECVWLGRRVVNLLWRDDMDTAFRHPDLCVRLGGPGPPRGGAFRWVARKGNIDPKSPRSLNPGVHPCWINPASPPSATAEAPAQSNGTTAKSAGTGSN